MLPPELWTLIEKGGIPIVTLYLVYRLERKVEKLIELITPKPKIVDIVG